MKILITGSNGFVGKNLVEFLKTKQDNELYLFDKPGTILPLSAILFSINSGSL